MCVDPAHWKDHYPECGKAEQSPINLRVNGAEVLKKNFTSLKFSAGYSLKSGISGSWANNGHSGKKKMYFIIHGSFEMFLQSFRFRKLRMIAKRASRDENIISVKTKVYFFELNVVYKHCWLIFENFNLTVFLVAFVTFHT